MIQDPVWRLLARPGSHEMTQLIKDLAYFHQWDKYKIDLILYYYSWTKEEYIKASEGERF